MKRETRVLKRKTNDQEVRIGDVIYDRMGNRYHLTKVGGERLIEGRHAKNPNRVSVSGADGWGLYFDPPYPKDAKALERERRAYWTEKVKSYLEIGE